MFTNYKYVVTPTKVIALSTYGGRVVRGIAKCHPDDTFNENVGKILAAARCNKNVAAKRYARACEEYAVATNKLHEIEAEFSKKAKYLSDSYEAYKEATKNVEEALAGIRA